jgi:hypothetical protein
LIFYPCFQFWLKIVRNSPIIGLKPFHFGDFPGGDFWGNLSQGNMPISPTFCDQYNGRWGAAGPCCPTGGQEKKTYNGKERKTQCQNPLLRGIVNNNYCTCCTRLYQRLYFIQDYVFIVLSSSNL